MIGGALDFGTSNSVLSRWDATLGRPAAVELPAICRQPGGPDELRAPRAIPTAVRARAPLSALDKLGRVPWIARRVFLGRQADIGQAAVERNETLPGQGFVASFKRHLLSGNGNRQVGTAWGRPVLARDAALLFLRELMAEVKRTTGTRIRDLVLTVPVDAFEAYRGELQSILASLGVARVRFIDEPVAAAMGYALTLSESRVILVIDFGAGTLHMAIAGLTPADARAGACHVIAKSARPIGGDVVDGWVASWAYERLGYGNTDGDDVWDRVNAVEARRVKEQLFFEGEEVFHATPPDLRAQFHAHLAGAATTVAISRAELVEILTARGLYAIFDECLGEVLESAERQGVSEDAIVDVLAVGGSTLLPLVYHRLEGRFGRDRVRAYSPFEAVSQGACSFAAGRIAQSDFIVHDYALVTFDSTTHEKQHTVIVPKNTRVPAEAVWRRQLVPTCSLGEPEKSFKLVICEIGKSADGQLRVAFDREGGVHRVGSEYTEPIIVPLNDANPVLGVLDPPHAPTDRQARLDVCFGVDENRWLVATVQDLRTRRSLMDRERVLRLL